MKARDPNDILREEGEDAVRATADSGKPFGAEPQAAR
jgi:hypothetical protein